MFTEKSFKNSECENISFEKNCVVLIQDKTSNNGNRTVKVLSFPNVPDTKPTTIIKHVLKCMLAEFQVTNAFNKEFAFFDTGAVTKTLNGTETREIVKTGIKAKKIFLPYLNSNTIYKTNNDGEISHAVKCCDGVLLKDTALNIKTEQLITLYGYNCKQFRAALHHTAQAVLRQAEFITAIETEHKQIENGLQELAKAEQETTTTKTTTKTATKVAKVA